MASTTLTADIPNGPTCTALSNLRIPWAEHSPDGHAIAASTLYAARGRLIPFNSNSPTGSTFTAFSTFINTRGLMRI